MVKLIWSPSSIAHLDAIADDMALDSEREARQFIVRIINAITEIPDKPMSGQIVQELKSKLIREQPFEHCRIIYRVTVHAIEIVAIMQSAGELEA